MLSVSKAALMGCVSLIALSAFLTDQAKDGFYGRPVGNRGSGAVGGHHVVLEELEQKWQLKLLL